MCYHKSQTKPLEKVAAYYNARYNDQVKKQHQIQFHENGFDFKPSAIVTAQQPDELQMYSWGFIASFNKSLENARVSRTQTLNCVSEEMYSKPSFSDAAMRGQRCLIPCSGFMEWKWMDDKGKSKIPYYIQVKEQDIFSLAGLYSTWKDPATALEYYTYTVLTAPANTLMSEIHNSKKRMPVIIPKQYEKDYLNPSLSRTDVLALCSSFPDSQMSAYTISKLITSKADDSNVEKVLEPFRYEAPARDIQTSLF